MNESENKVDDEVVDETVESEVVETSDDAETETVETESDVVEETIEEKPQTKAKKKAKKKVSKKVKSKVQYVAFKNVHTHTLRILGATIEPKKQSRSFTIEQAKAVRGAMRPYIDNEWIVEVKIKPK